MIYFRNVNDLIKKVDFLHTSLIIVVDFMSNFAEMNYTFPFLPPTCENAQLFADSIFLETVHWAQIGLSILSICAIILIIVYRLLKLKRLALHKNLRV